MTVPLAVPLLAIPPDATPTDTLAILAKTKRRIIGPQSVKSAAIKSGAVEQSVGGVYRSQDPRLTTRFLPDSSSCSALPTQMPPRQGQPRIRCLLYGLKPRASSPAFLSVSSNTGPELREVPRSPRPVRSDLVSVLPATLSAVSTLLAANAYDVVANQLVFALSPPQSSSTASSARPDQSKAIEALLRALKALYGDLVKVVGPREWGTDVIGASIDAVERRDAESLWTRVAADRAKVADDKGKGKGKEGDSAIGSVEGLDAVDLAQLQAKADEVLLRAFAESRPGSAVGPSAPTHASTSPRSYARSELLNRLLLHVLVSPAASGEAERMRQVDLLCGFLAGTVRSPLQREALVHGDEGAQAIATLRELVQIAPDKASAHPFSDCNSCHKC